MPNVSVTINGVTRSVREGVTILEACETAGVEIPTLCYHPDLSLAGNCRMCLVEVEGWRTLAIACVTPVTPNMKIMTHSKKVRHARRTVLKLLLASHNVNCPECERNNNCELQELAEKHNITTNEFQTAERLQHDYWLYVVFNCASNPELHLVRNPARLGWKPIVRIEHYHVGPQDILQGEAAE